MQKPVLVIMAAGMGSRYGGLKQIDPIDAAGNLILDYSAFDAKRAGFDEVVFLIKHEIEADFRAAIGDRIAGHMHASYAFQQLDMLLPAGAGVPAGREKPWGTTHAVLCAREQIGNRPFAVINADDYYGPAAFREVYGFLCAPHAENEHALVGYRLENTLTEHGSVARGVCRVENGYLADIVERKKIYKREHCGAFTTDGVTFAELPFGTPVSMNCWGFGPAILQEFERQFRRDFAAGIAADPLKFEHLLPGAVQTAMAERGARVRVLETPDQWYGVTYREDKDTVVSGIARLKEQGLYSRSLWD